VVESKAEAAKTRIFVCYSHEDDVVVHEEVARLTAAGHELWYDQDIRGGSNWRAEVGRSIERCSAVLFFISRHSIVSEHCNREINLALDEGKQVIPVYLEQVELTPDLKVGLNRVQALRWDSSDGYRAALLNAFDAGAPTLAPLKTPPKSRRRSAAIAMGGVVALMLGSWYFGLRGPDTSTSSAAQMVYPLPDVPSIAVLPFRTIGNEPLLDASVADGMTDDLITDLSQLSQLFVVARNSMFAFKGRTVTATEVSNQLGVRYVLDGSVRGTGDTLRVNAQLIDATTGRSVWADRYDGERAQLFVLQDKVVNAIVSALNVRLSEGEHTAVTRMDSANPRAREAFLRGWAAYRDNSPETFAQAIRHLDEAVQLDQGYLRAYAARAAVYQAALARDFTVRFGEWTRSLGVNTDDAIRNVLINLRAAARDRSALTLQVESQLALSRNDFDRALAAANEAILLAPNDPLGYEALSAASTLGGDPAAGRRAIERAMRLDPGYPNEYLFWHGLAMFSAGDFDDARVVLERAAALNPGDDRILIVLAAAYGFVNRFDDSQATIASFDALQNRREDAWSRGAPGDLVAGIHGHLPGRYTLTQVDLWPFRYVADRERLREGLRLGGLPPMGPQDNQIPLTVDGATTVSIEEARELFERGVAIVDVRGLSDRNIGYIPGSTFLNLQTQFSEAALRRVVDPDQEVLFHCEGMR